MTISKSVTVADTGTVIDASQFIPGVGVGTPTFAGAGMQLSVAGTTDQVSRYFPRFGPLPDSASLEWQQTSGSGAPGLQILFDTDSDFGNGYWNILVGSGSGNWWLSPNSSPASRALAPHSSNGTFYGTLAEWKQKIPGARMLAGGFSLGTGSAASAGVLKSVTYDGDRYAFGSFGSSATAAPGATLEYKLIVSNEGQTAAAGVQVLDTLPADLTYVPGSLIEFTGVPGDPSADPTSCSFVTDKLTCAAGSFTPGTTTVVKFKATLSRTINTANLPTTAGHYVTVQKQEVFAELKPLTTATYTSSCAPGYRATDGSLLVDAVDQGGDYSDIVTRWSKPTADGSGWTVKASNFGEFRGQGKVHVTCLSTELGSSAGHTHTIVVDPPTSVISSWAAASGANGRTVTLSCDPGERAIAPGFEVNAGVITVRGSYAPTANSWRWVVDNEEDTDVTFSISCLRPQTSEVDGHTADLSLTAATGSVSVGAGARREGQLQCPDNGHGIVGGYLGADADVLSLGKEPRGTNYMFRFANEFGDSTSSATFAVTCVGVRTASEPTFYQVLNTATVSTTSPEADQADNASSATVKVTGPPVPLPEFDVVVKSTGSRTIEAGKTRSVDLKVKCVAGCTFSVKVLNGATVVAKANKSLAADAGFKNVKVKTTAAGKALGAVAVVVKVTTTDGSRSYNVTLS